MALRRLAQNNAAAATPKREADSPVAKPRLSMPTTPRNRVSIGPYRSPASTPSLSATIPFDWEAARSRAPPPYTPLQRKLRQSTAGDSTDSPRPVRRAFVRKKGFFEKLRDTPSNVAFYLSMFPQNLPLPSAKASSRILAGIMHLAQFSLRVSKARRSPSNWEDIYGDDDDAWFDWTSLLTVILLGAAFANAAYLLSRTRKYHFHRRVDPISSPNAKFVPKDWDTAQPLRRPLWRRSLSFSWWAFISSWRFLLNIPSPPPAPANAGPASKIQELEVWTPNELELQLFSLYSPVHALLWQATSSANWITMLFCMGLLTITLNVLIFQYQMLVKDKEAIAAEVMSEYNEGFVYPRINPIRHDVGVMTHESEIVSVWD
ncbi:hypothetical protein CC1G_04239 [Coprinopsis cinerea okayama7|uniref:Nuclear rim protein 1 n=1 Tax=Coprinopsis cinerea (strain Okayama-7 / 130 / ATCC MYA-4618 / FGSC 9003) TaxID=240176 RepID=A8NFE0_COPC7|nr:hypothetical protein CC1G_04239 [Coprinopsis cinerea okayama7\|eukprot:XP_001833260.2 hypothetical protein CC1G_04239 [Coprinopsis cinerea okayama7\